MERACRAEALLKERGYDVARVVHGPSFLTTGIHLDTIILAEEANRL